MAATLPSRAESCAETATSGSRRGGPRAGCATAAPHGGRSDAMALAVAVAMALTEVLLTEVQAAAGGGGAATRGAGTEDGPR